MLAKDRSYSFSILMECNFLLDSTEVLIQNPEIRGLW
jgi:hypothetical protein